MQLLHMIMRSRELKKKLKFNKFYYKSSKITFYFNGKQAKSPINTVVKEPIKYIGNSKDKREPFGVLCDFRIYANILSLQQIKEISNYNEKQGKINKKLKFSAIFAIKI